MNHSEAVLVEKTVDAPIEKVWQAWEDPEKLAKWWRLSSIKEAVITEYDFRPGGTWRQHGIAQEGYAIGENNPGVEFKEIVPLEKIVTVPKHIEGDSVEVTPDLLETVVTFESVDDNHTKVSVTLVRNKDDDWQPNELQKSVYSELFDNLATFVTQE